MDRWPTPLPASPPLAVLDANPQPCYAVSEDLNLTYCNAAWDQHAREEGGTSAAMAGNVISRNLLGFVAPELISFYRDLFGRARALGGSVSHDYECSTPLVFRLYRMEVYPMRPGAGFVVENSLRVERPHDRPSVEPSDDLYKDKNGIIHCCANCRRTLRVNGPPAWDWVPTYLESRELNISHGVCPMCLEFYYRPTMDNLAA